uniref:Uncharacterized protein pdi310 n=1 Tax=Pholiota microspora TaxID=1538424 RepID=G3XKS3_PHOMI|nr:hypothetical protein [Pholiota nameko]
MFAFSLLKLAALATALQLTAAINIREADDKAAASCTDWSIIPNTATIAAVCRDSNGGSHNTNIPLSDCTGNQNGVIACQHDGGAGSSCIFSNIQFSSTFLTATASCLNRAGQRVDTNNFDLNACLTNTEGTLTC